VTFGNDGEYVIIRASHNPAGFMGAVIQRGVILRDGNYLPPTLNVKVGERINLSVDVRPSTSISDIGWSIDGVYIGDYDPQKDTKQVTKLSEDDLQMADVSFCWVDDGDHVVSVAYVANGDYFQTKATFHVTKPATTFWTTWTQDISLSWNKYQVGNTTNGQINVGIVFILENSEDQLNFLQTADVRRVTVQDPSNVVTPWHKTGLDGQWPYGFDSPQHAGTNDFPGFPYNNYGKELTINDNFVMTLMYRPDSNGTWVPIQSVQWYWVAKIIKNGPNWDQWDFVEKYKFKGETKSTTTFPTWDSVVPNANPEFPIY